MQTKIWQIALQSVLLVLIIQLGVAPAVFAAKSAPAAASESDEEEVEPVPPKKVQPAETDEEPSEPGRTGWRSRNKFGVWWHSYDVQFDGKQHEQPGLASLSAEWSREYSFSPVYVGLGADIYAPQLLYKAVGLGFFYFFCFFLTAGNCNASPSFATGDRDAGYVGFGPKVGFDLHPAPVEFYGGLDVGLFHSGLTPNPFSTVFVKGGMVFNFNRDYGLDLSVRRSALMNPWADDDNSIKDPSVWLITFSLITPPLR